MQELLDVHEPKEGLRRHQPTSSNKFTLISSNIMTINQIVIYADQITVRIYF